MKNKFAFWIMLGTVLFAGQAYAEDNFLTPFEVKVWGKFSPEVDVESQSGKVGVGKVNIRILGRFQPAENVPLEVSVGGDHYVLSSSDGIDLPAGLKSRGLHVDTMFPLPFGDGQTFYSGWLLNPSFQSANTAAFDKSNFRMRGGAYFAYKAGEDLIVKGGAVYRDQYRQDIFPYIGLHYKINEQWGIDVSSTEAVVSSYLRYHLTEASEIFIESEYNMDEFEENGGINDGKIIEFADQTVGIGLKHTFCKYATASLSGGGIFQRRIEYMDGVTGKYAPKIAPYLGFSLLVDF